MKIKTAILFILLLAGSALALGGGGSWPYNGVVAIPPTHMFGGIGVADASGVVYFRTETNAGLGTATVKARKFNNNGSIGWEQTITGGKAAFFEDYRLRPAVLTSDGNMVVVYADKRKDPTSTSFKTGTTEVYATKIDPSNGAIIWESLVSSADAINCAPSVAVDNNGGVYVSYISMPDDQNIFIQHLNSNGNRQWLAIGQNGLQVSNSTKAHDANCTVEDGLGNAWVVWLEGTHDDQFMVYARNIKSTGTLESIVVLTPTDTSKNFGFYAWNSICPDGSGGIVAAWNQEQLGSSYTFAQSVNKNGIIQWGTNGKQIFDGSEPMVAVTALNEVVISSSGGYAKKYTISSGELNPNWAGTGDSGILITGSLYDMLPAICPDGQGGIFAFYMSGRNEKDSAKFTQFIISLQNGFAGLDPTTEIDIYGQRLSAQGQKLWNPDVAVRRLPFVTLFPLVAKSPAGPTVYPYWIDMRDIVVPPATLLDIFFKQPIYAAMISETATPEISVLTANGSVYFRGMNVINGVNITGNVRVTNSTFDLPYGTVEVSWDGTSFEGMSVTGVSSTQADFLFSKVLADGEHRFLLRAADNYGNYSTFEGLVAASATTPIIDQIKFDDRSYRRGDYISAIPTVKGRIRTQATAFSAAGSNLKINFNKAGFSNTENISHVYTIDTATGTFEHTLATALPEDGEYGFSLTGSDIYSHVGTFEGLIKLGAQTTILKDAIAYGSGAQSPWKFSPQKESLNIAYQLSRSADIIINIISIDGRNIYKRIIKAGEEGAHYGPNSVSWDGSSDFGGKAGNGAYLIRLMSGKTILFKGAIIVVD